MYHERSKIVLLHACGHMRDLLPMVRETGLDGIESLNPPPTGNTELAYGREVLGPGRSIWGGLDPVFFLRATPAEIEQEVRQIISVVAPGDHFVLMPADSTPAGVPLDHFDVVRRTIDRYGRWS